MTMKKLVAIIAAAITGLITLPTEAEAGHGHAAYTYRSGHSACGCPIYTKRYFTGYDCHRRPVYRYAAVPVVHRCRSHACPPVHYRHHNYYKHSRYHRPVRRPGYAHRPVVRRGHGYRPGCR